MMVRGTALCCFFFLVCASLSGCHGDKAEHGSDSGEKTAAGKGTSASGDKSSGGSADDKASVPSTVVKIAPEDQARVGVQIAQVIVHQEPTSISVPGQVTMDEKHTNHIGALADGRIETVRVLPGDSVRRGQTLATLHSHTVHETVAALEQAYASVTRQRSAVGFALQARDRYSKLYAIQAASLEEKQRAEQELAQAQKDLTDAIATMIAEREHLAEILQVPPESLQPGTLYQRELVPVRAVEDGVVIKRNITPGQVVSTGDELFVTTNLSTVWIEAAINEKDLLRVRVGRPATVTGPEPSLQRSGTVTMVGDTVDPQTRTLPVRVLVANTGYALRPGMFVNAAIAGPETRTAIYVPEDALQDINGFRVVFVTDGQQFRAVPVKTGLHSGNLVEITEGLSPADRVVSRGAFTVKGELLKGTVGEG